MFRGFNNRIFPILLFVLLGIFPFSEVKASVYLKRIDLSTLSGSNPYGSLTLKDGKFYGLTNLGGLNTDGSIFEWDSMQNTYTKKVDLDNASGVNPFGSLVERKDKFYGLTSQGGKYNSGVIFEWDSTKNIFIKKFDFSGVSGKYPYGSLSLMGNKFYGFTHLGGLYNKGVIFEWDPETNTYTKKFDFDGANGSYPFYGSLVFHNKKFYGMTFRGGINNMGVIFEWDPFINVYAKKFDFNGVDGNYPYNSSLTFYDGKFYGLTSEGGISDQGVFFEWEPNKNTYTKKFDFNYTTVGSYPYCSVTLMGNILYGVTSAGGLNDKGTIFEWNSKNDTFVKRFDFSENLGSFPNGSLALKENKLYGMTVFSGLNGKGVIFEWDPNSNSFTVSKN